MKMRKIYRALLALALMFSLIVPAFATEGETVSPTSPVTEAQPPEPPEEDAEPPEDEEQTTEPPETPDVSEDPGGEDQPETPEAPEPPETPETPSAPENPETPENPEPPENPDTPETPPTPEAPVTPEAPGTPAPEDPTLPPAWLLPPEQIPAQPAPPVEAPRAEPPLINVVVPDAGTVIVNPYRLPVMVDGQETREQIAGGVLLLENHSNVAVDVSVSAAGSAQGGVVLTTRPPAEDAPEKEVFLYAEFQATESYGQTVSWQEFFSDTPNQLQVPPYGSAKDGLMRLEASGLPYSWGAVRLSGSAAAHPAQPWEAGDGFHVSLAFTFTPVIPEVPVLDAPGGTDVDSTLVLPADPNVIPDWIIPSGPVLEPEPDAGDGLDAILPDPIIPVEEVQDEISSDVERRQRT